MSARFCEECGAEMPATLRRVRGRPRKTCGAKCAAERNRAKANAWNAAHPKERRAALKAEVQP